MPLFKQYDIFELLKDLNPNIKKGMVGVILEVYDENTYEVEFVKGDATNYEFEGKSTFTIKDSYMKQANKAG